MSFGEHFTNAKCCYAGDSPIQRQKIIYNLSLYSCTVYWKGGFSDPAAKDNIQLIPVHSILERGLSIISSQKQVIRSTLRLYIVSQ